MATLFTLTARSCAGWLQSIAPWPLNATIGPIDATTRLPSRDMPMPTVFPPVWYDQIVLPSAPLRYIMLSSPSTASFDPSAEMATLNTGLLLPAFMLHSSFPPLLKR